MSYYYDGEQPGEYEESPCDLCDDLATCPIAYNVESHECARLQEPAEDTKGDEFDE